MPFSEMNQHTLEDLKQRHPAGARTGQDVRPTNACEQMMEQLQRSLRGAVQQLLDRLVQKLIDEGHITID